MARLDLGERIRRLLEFIRALHSRSQLATFHEPDQRLQVLTASVGDEQLDGPVGEMGEQLREDEPAQRPQYSEGAIATGAAAGETEPPP